MSHDLSIIIVSTNEAHWLRRCLDTVYAHAGSANLDVVVVDNESSDGAAELVERHFPLARVVQCRNRGFPHANNRALMTPLARYVLFLNPDTEVVEGEFGELVDLLDARPEVGLLGAKQLTGDGQLFPTIRRFPNAARALGEALTSEGMPGRPSWVGDRELDPRNYERDRECDWTVGAFMLARREALLSSGFMDERFFLYSDEPDLCLRLRQAGWLIMHSPVMTIVHHAGKAGVKPRLAAQEAYARRLYAQKHFAPAHRLLYIAAVAIRYGLRAVAVRDRSRRAAARSAFWTVLGRSAPPFGAPPPTSIDPATVPGSVSPMEAAGSRR
jgi:N-acetylglucosaminyl-diphospho-decaprenol L-rhamnosyltransferase